MWEWRRVGAAARILLIVVCLAGPVGVAQAALLYVDDDNCPGPGSGTPGDPYCEIQVAIDAAIPSLDDVVVRCGTYNENIVLEDQVDVTGEGAHCTIIDGGANGSSVVTIIGVTQGVLEGFTIRNGSAGLGGGIYLENSSSTIRQNRIEGNTAVGGATGLGGGIHVTEPLTRDLATAPVITKNVIVDNVAEGFGGGIEIYGGEATITNNLIEDNRANESGGGIDIFFNASVSVSNNTIIRNCLQSHGAVCQQGGGGIAIDGNSAVDIINNVVAWNEADPSFGGGIDLASGLLTILSNDVVGNVPVDYAGIGDQTGTNGNISTDPLFVDQAPSWRGYLPRSDSPLVDGGAAVPALADDLRGIPRPLDGDASGSAAQDIGARENEGVTRLLPGVPDIFNWDPSIDLAAQYNLYRGDLQTLIDTGVYVQDPTAGLGAAQWCGLVSPSQSDSATPDPGQVYFYIAVVANTVEGTLGFDSTPAERPFTDPNRCP
jgi:hypothetical protein